MAVCPIELDMYAAVGEGIDTYHARYEAEQAALQSFKNMVILRPNLVFGEYGYTTRFMTQCVMAGRIPKALNSGSFKYSPVHHDDISQAVS